MNKYNLRWQTLRISLKQVPLQHKLEAVLNFYNKYKSQANQERTINYLKGLYISVKDPTILQFINLIKNVKWNQKDTDINISDVDTKQLTKLYRDLYNRNRKWLNNNYRNKALNDFLELLYNELTVRQITVKKNFDIFPTGKSVHKFIF